MPGQAPAEEAEANDSRPDAEHLPDAGKKPAIVTAARSHPPHSGTRSGRSLDGNRLSADFLRSAAEGRGVTLNGRNMHAIDTDDAQR